MNTQNPAELPVEQMVPAACAQIHDFPKPGILFYDVTTLFANPQAFRRCIDELADRFAGGSTSLPESKHAASSSPQPSRTRLALAS